MTFNTGDVLQHEGAESTATSRFYVLTEGFCSVTKGDADVQTVRPNDTIGEIELMYAQPAACTIVAHTKVTAWALDRHTYRHLVSGIFAKKRNLYEEFLSKVHASVPAAAAVGVGEWQKFPFSRR